MPKVIETAKSKPHISSKLHRHLKKLPEVKVSLREVQQSLSNIGISLSKRVIEEREKR